MYTPNQVAIFMFKGHVTKESQVFVKDYKNMYFINVPRLEPFGGLLSVL